MVTFAFTTVPPLVTLKAMKLVKHWPDAWYWQISAPVVGAGGVGVETLNETVPELPALLGSPP